MEEKIRILVVDDEPNSTKLLHKVLTKRGYVVEEINDSKKAIQSIEDNDYDIIVSDLQMPDVTGLDLLKNKKCDSIFIMITGYGSIDSAVDSMKHGAYDYISKPFNIEEFSMKVDKASEKVKLMRQVKNLQSQIGNIYSYSNIIGKSSRMMKVYDAIRKVSQSNVNILIEGASGTGKELVSRAIHANSRKCNGPFVAINCSAIPENLLENELFGHVKGAFTGATDAQKGVFEQANGGTLLLDEIAEMPYGLQAKLLRVIENWEIKPLGSDKTRKIDVRLISATNQKIKDLVNQKKFREDLFYRIATVVIPLPTLNERTEDIPLFADHFLKKFSSEYNRTYTITADAVELLMKYQWNGNVRELEHAIERAVITSQDGRITKRDFGFLKSGNEEGNIFNEFENLDLKNVERLYIKKVLEENNWNKVKAASILNIDRKTLYKKIKDYHLE